MDSQGNPTTTAWFVLVIRSMTRLAISSACPGWDPNACFVLLAGVPRTPPGFCPPTVCVCVCMCVDRQRQVRFQTNENTNMICDSSHVHKRIPNKTKMCPQPNAMQLEPRIRRKTPSRYPPTKEVGDHVASYRMIAERVLMGYLRMCPCWGTNRRELVCWRRRDQKRRR